ncbi:ribonuclease P protein component [Patescibacteria group bacterium]
MLKRHNRLRKQRQIDRIFKEGRRFHSKDATIHVSWEKDGVEYPPRGTIVVSKKVAKKATDRNRIKRQVRSIIESIIDELPANLLFIIVVRSDFAGKTYQEIEAEIYTLLKRSKIWPQT